MTHLLAALLGFVSLGAEVLLVRSAERLLGNTSVTLACVLGSWLMGLAVGARCGAALLRRIDRPSFILGWVLLAFAASLMVVIRLLPYLGPLPVFARVGMLIMLLGIPAVAAGFAFPLLVRLVHRDGDGSGAPVGTIVAMETLGAVIGSVAAAFFLLRSVGLLRSLDAIAMIAILGGACSFLWRYGRETSAERRVAEHRGREGDRWPLLALACSGAALLALELVWTRLLLFHIPGLMSSLASVLAGMLLGTSVGGFLGASVARRGGGRRAAMIFLVLGVCAVGISLLLTRHLADFILMLPGPTGGGFRPGMEMVAAFAAACVLAFLPSMCSGAALPLVAGFLGREPGETGGRVYAWSSAGSIVGVVLAAVGAGVWASLDEFVIGAACLLLLGAVSLWRPSRDGILAPVLIGVALLIVFVPSHGGPLLARSVEFRRSYALDREVEEELQDRHVVASVVSMGDDEGVALYTNSFLAASTQDHYGYMRMLGHLPALLAEDPGHALVIAYGTGTTVGSLSLHKDVESMDIVELSSAVMQLAPWFAPVNHGIPYRDDGGKDVKVYQDDGRLFVDRDVGPYNLITLEPLPPHTPAAVHFYTREFYQRCRERLSPGGIMCQWIPIHTSPPKDFRILLKTIAEEFPTAWVFLFNQCVLIIGGERDMVSVDGKRLWERTLQTEVQADLVRAGMEGASAILASYVGDRESVLRSCADVEVMKDDRPLVALRLAQPNRDSLDNLAANAAYLLSIRSEEGPALDMSSMERRVQSDLRASLSKARESKRLLLEARVRPGDAASLASRALEICPDDLEARSLLMQLGLDVAPGDVDEDIRSIEIQLRSPPDNVDGIMMLIEQAGDHPEVDPLLVLPFLDHDNENVRLHAMVVLGRLVGDLGGYDPSFGRDRRRTAIDRLRKRLK